MSHIDEGQLHALLDDALDPGAAGQVRQHLAACGQCAVLLEEERAVRARANAILDLARPATSSIPPFETVLRRAEQPASRAGRLPGPMRMAWAATIVLALGIGWLSRDFAPRSTDRAESSTAVDALSDAARVQETAPPPPPSAPPAVAPSGAAAVRGAVVGAVREPAPVAEAASQERARAETGADQAAKTAAQGVAANTTAVRQQNQMAQAPQQQQLRDAQARLARVDTAGRARVLAAAPPPAPAEAARRVLRWEYLDLAAAEQRVGATILVVPGLRIDSVAVQATPPEGYLVRVIHRLPGNDLLELQQTRLPSLQLKTEAVLESRADPSGFYSVTLTRDDLQLTGRARLQPDSIRALLRRAR